MANTDTQKKRALFCVCLPYVCLLSVGRMEEGEWMTDTHPTGKEGQTQTETTLFACTSASLAQLRQGTDPSLCPLSVQKSASPAQLQPIPTHRHRLTDKNTPISMISARGEKKKVFLVFLFSVSHVVPTIGNFFCPVRWIDIDGCLHLQQICDMSERMLCVLM